ncbi:MAG: hypothetical protein ABI091_26840 [Ferruginibacter sp.]
MKHLFIFLFLFSVTISGFSQSATDTLLSVATPGAHTTIASYKWTQTSGAAFQKFLPNGNQLIFTVTVPGNYTIDCTATDSENQTVSLTTYVTAFIVGKPTMIITPYSTPTNPIILKIQ